MNLYRGILGSSAASPLTLLNPVSYARRVLQRNILATASNSSYLSTLLVQRSIGTIWENEEYNFYPLTRPILDRFLLGKFYGFVTKGCSELEIKDFKKAQEQLNSYHKIYNMMLYAEEIYKSAHMLQVWLLTNDSTILTNVWRNVSFHNPRHPHTPLRNSCQRLS